MLTVTQLARRCGLSRTAVLYYESVGLLKKPPRTEGNYRAYGEKDLDRLRRITVYRSAGLKLEDIRSLLDRPSGDAAGVLKRRLAEIGGEIERLREHQQAIVRLLTKTGNLRRANMITKDKWIEIMRAAGFKQDDMNRWHSEFERMAPAEHQEFLEFLHIPADEITSIREWSRGVKPR